MSLLRVVLFLGLVLHKAVWEIMKRREPRKSAQPKQVESTPKRMLKLVKIGILGFLVIQTLFLNLFPISTDPTVIIVVGLVIYTVGLIVAITGRFQLGNNWANLEDYKVIDGQNLVQTGIYSYIRHPIYTGDILLILGLELALNSWLVLLVIPLAFVVFKQTVAEEAVLSQAFPNYSDYSRRTKMFIPYIV
jgi:protein-S-isoprenylcysteine O-methyltransferase Ste14